MPDLNDVREPTDKRVAEIEARLAELPDWDEDLREEAQDLLAALKALEARVETVDTISSMTLVEAAAYAVEAFQGEDDGVPYAMLSTAAYALLNFVNEQHKALRIFQEQVSALEAAANAPETTRPSDD